MNIPQPIEKKPADISEISGIVFHTGWGFDNKETILGQHSNGLNYEIFSNTLDGVVPLVADPPLLTLPLC